MWDLLRDPNVQWVLTGSLLLGISGGVIGTFALLRGRSLLGDVLAHAALPGVCLAFLATGSKEILPLLLGAGVSGILATRGVDAIGRWTRLKEDTALGVVLTVFFGVGIVLLTTIQHSGAGNQSGLDSFLFGQAAALVRHDVMVMGVVALVSVLSVLLFYKEFKALCFDPGFATGVGLPMKLVDGMLMALLVMAVVIGLQAVGVVLMAALLITPGIAARYWTERLGTMLLLSGTFGGISGAAGTFASTLGVRLPTGPLIVLSATLLFVVSLLCAPERGLVAKSFRFVKLRRKVARENFLRDVYELYELSVDRPSVADNRLLARGISLDALIAKSRKSSSDVRRLAHRLQNQGLIRIDDRGAASLCTLTQKGIEEAWYVVHRHRLWEMFLMHEADLNADHVDRDADDVEHFLTPDMVGELERYLKVHQREPRLLPSVHPLTGEASAL